MGYSADQWLCGKILEYVNDDKHKYAIAIKGAWGSGKTRFVNSVLAPILKDKNKRLVRVSMFGIENADELYQRIGAVLLRIEGGGEYEGKVAKVGRRVVGNVPNFAEAAMSFFGISVQLDVGMKFAVDVLASGKHVLVFDDVERRSNAADDLSLFGAVNELVEGRGLKAIFVIGEGSLVGEAERLFDYDIREKLIWRTYEYRQSVDSLVDSMFAEFRQSSSRVDIVECVRVAVERRRCVNVRALLKARLFVCELVKASVLLDPSVYCASLRFALIDMLEFVLMVCQGEGPEKPVVPEGDGNRKFSVELWQAEQEYARYLELPCIDAFFCSSKGDVEVDVDGDVRAYLGKRYPNSDAAQVIQELTSMMSYWPAVSDDMVVPLAVRLATVIRERSLSCVLIRDAVTFNMRLLSFGIQNLVSKEELVEACVDVLERDHWGAFEFVRYYDTQLSRGDAIESILDNLKDRAIEIYSKGIAREVAASMCDVGQPKLVIDVLNRLLVSGLRGIILIPPHLLLQAFDNLGPEGQEEVRRLVYKSDSHIGVGEEDKVLCYQWLSDLRQLLLDDSSGDRLAMVRKRYFVQNIEEMIDRYAATE